MRLLTPEDMKELREAEEAAEAAERIKVQCDICVIETKADEDAASRAARKAEELACDAEEAVREAWERVRGIRAKSRKVSSPKLSATDVPIERRPPTGYAGV